jgi:hypothetical protein
MISHKEILAMLSACAAGFKIELKTHNYFVYYNKLTYPTLPKYGEVEAGHVKKMARAPGIYECAKKFFKW